jgi:prepilin-type N-terminal cleavage/methylation domain-containing protein
VGRARRRTEGFTLVELLVAMTAFAMFSLGMAVLSVGVLAANGKAKSMDVAVFLAHDRLEAIRNTSYGSITSANFPAEAYGTITVGTPPVSYPNFQRSVTIQDNTPASGMKRVMATVSWAGGSVSEEMVVGQ